MALSWVYRTVDGLAGLSIGAMVAQMAAKMAIKLDELKAACLVLLKADLKDGSQAATMVAYLDAAMADGTADLMDGAMDADKVDGSDI